MISATLSMDEAVDECWDAIVVGAGPAGTVAARELTGRGVRTLLVDRSDFPRDKVCGGCLNTEGVAALHDLGLGPNLQSLGGHPLHRIDVWSDRRHHLAELPGGLAISRYRLDRMLVESAIAAGADFLPGVHVRLRQQDTASETRTLDCRAGGQDIPLTAKVVVLATGLTGDPLKGPAELKFHQSAHSRIGIQASVPNREVGLSPGTITMAVGRCGYVGLTVVEDDRLNIAAAVDLSAVRRLGPESVCREILAESGIPLEGIPHVDDWNVTVGLTRSRRSQAAERVFLVGDAAGYVEPFTGEGMAAAIRSGRAVAPFVEKSLAAWDPRLIAQWNQTIYAQVTRRQWICRGLSQIVRRPDLVRYGIGLAGRVPAVGRLLVRMVS